MSSASWRSVFFCALFSLTVIILSRLSDATLEGSSMGYLGKAFSQEPVAFPQIIRVSDVKASHDGHAVTSRRKRNIFYQSGLRLCGQETAEEVVANHLGYFHLRVCQETVWEAFKIFWDRLPEQDEYQSWMSRCQEGTVAVQDIGSYFSQSEEHQALVKERMSHSVFKSEPTRSWKHMCSTPTPASSETVEAPDLEETDKEKDITDVISPEVEESPLFNEITIQPTAAPVLEQVVELSILLTGEVFSDELRDPASLKFQTLSRDLAEKIEDALEGLPGFKSVSVIDFRPQKDSQWLDGIVVDYAVTVAVDGAGVSSEQLNYLTLQSNLVENSYREIKEPPTVVYTISGIKNIFTEPHHIDELESVSEIPEPVRAADEATGIDLSEVLTLDHPTGGGSSPPVELNTLGPEEDIVILEESELASPEAALATSPPEAGSIEEEDLLPEDAVLAPAPETIPPKELLPEPPSQETPKSSTLPEPPIETEASGSGRENLDSLIEPSIEEEDQISLVETEDVKSEPEQEKVDEVEILEKPEVSTVLTKTTIEQGQPALLPPTETVNIPTEASEPDVAKTTLHSDVDEPVVQAPEDSSKFGKDPDQDVGINVIFTYPEEPAFDEKGFDETIESDGSEVKEGSLSEARDIEEEAPLTPEILAGDLVEDEILLVNRDDSKLPGTDFPRHPLPTALFPEEETPFTVISSIVPDFDALPDKAITSLTTQEDLDDASPEDHGYDLIPYDYGLTNQTEEGSTGSPFSVAQGTDQVSIAMPINPRRALIVFFSLRVTNMVFSEDLFNKSSPEYKALEQRFLELLVPYLQSNLSHFENLEILNFRNGSIVVNSRMKFGRPVARGVTTTVYLILEDFCNTAYQTMNLAIDKYSLDVESGDQADPCKFQACNEYAECKVNKWSGEAECVCNAGYFSVDGLPCQSICELQTDFCLNDGKCDIIPGQGAICRCRVGENWWYRGEHCEEYVSEPLVVGIAIASVAGFLFVASGVLFFLARTLRDQYDKEESEDPVRRVESLPSLERATKYNPMYESEATTGYSHYYRRYPEAPTYSSASAEASTDFSSEEIRHIYENSELTKEEIQDRIRIIELYAKDRQFADFVRQHQAVLDTQRESSSMHS
ncbi:interphotoreceptor matrix proteoglycan 2-like isoform X1 [Poecilia formosa]|uniref:interphotoreceptor matrix proteoglycan 2-like isoform X1 n=1 Tax=Poecilia formosa TaxID=48698 RepID=UPI0007B98793|nr:PREDICTED: interphotoreceptor matrix proteoglycan 2-like isoform X1 [Poecilia formosa]